MYFLGQYSSKLTMYSNPEGYVFFGSFITRQSLIMHVMWVEMFVKNVTHKAPKIKTLFD